MNFKVLAFITFTVFVVLRNTYTAQHTRHFGCIIESDERLEIVENVEYSRAASIPVSFSLETLMPEIGDQGPNGTCTVWAAVYHAFTVLKRYEDSEFKESFNPYSVWNPLKSRYYGTNACEKDGGVIVKVLDHLIQYGAETFDSYEHQKCRFEDMITISSEKLADFKKINPNKSEQIKYLISTGQPVIFGMNVYNTDQGESNNFSDKYITSEGLFDFPKFKSLKASNGHSVCVIGYDDLKFGGAFKIANSWGKNWGDAGYFWLRYKDTWTIGNAYALLRKKSIDASAIENSHDLSSIVIKNFTNKKLQLALAYKEGSDFISKGWFKLYPKIDRKIKLAERISEDLYYLVMDEDGNVHGNNAMLVDHKKFGCNLDSTFYCFLEKCDSSYNFKKVNQNKGNNIFVLGPAKENMKKDYGNYILGNFDHEDIAASNINWNGTYLLIDPVNLEVISDISSEKLKTEIYYLDKDKIKHKTIQNKKIFKFTKEKFSTFQSANIFLEQNE